MSYACINDLISENCREIFLGTCFIQNPKVNTNMNSTLFFHNMDGIIYP